MSGFLRISSVLLILLCFISLSKSSLAAEIPEQFNLLINDDNPYKIQIVALSDQKLPLSSFHQTWNITLNSTDAEITFQNGIAELASIHDNKEGLIFLKLSHQNTAYRYLFHIKTNSHGKVVKAIPLWTSILPPLMAILLAFVFKEVLISLFMGIWLGVILVNGWYWDQIFPSFLRIIDTYVIEVMMDTGHISVIVFSLLIGGMVAIISANGGMAGIVFHLSKYAKTAKSTQLVTWLMGILIFFDDYANTLIVGNTMRPVTDKFRISRAKLAYIVDSTAAPIASIAFITTWIGAELGYIGDALKNTPITETPYSMFIGSLKYAFYPLFTLFFMFLMIYYNKAFGPMMKAEINAFAGKDDAKIKEETTTEIMFPTDGRRFWYALVPVLLVVIVTFLGLIVTGYDENAYQSNTGFFKKLSEIIGNADTYKALLWASFTGLAAAILITVGTKSMNLLDTMESMIDGFKSLLTAMIILIAAWSLALLTEQLYTAEFLSQLLIGNFPVTLMPALTFLLAALIAFSTGSSWSTMAILFPLALPTALSMALIIEIPEPQYIEILFHVIASVMAGAVLGDHCSPISDTTILSSLASGCHHIEHVRTQMPYALTVGIISLLIGGIGSGIGIPWYLCYLLGFIAIALSVKLMGKSITSA